MGSLAPIVMSATTFGGSAQYAAISVLDAGGGAVAAIAAAVLLNARYAPISISVGPAFEGPAWRRFLEAQLIVDESWAISAVGPGEFSRRRLVGAGLVLYVAWIGGTTVGVVGANLIGDPERLGLDAAFPALFVALLVPQVRERRALAAAIGGAAIALALVPFCRAGHPDRRRERRLPHRAPLVSTVWTVVAVAGMATFALKAVGPVFLGGRELPAPVIGVVSLLAPALLAALVATQVLGGDRELVLDERLVGLAAAVMALALRAPILVVVVAAAAATALARAFF